jgi:prevent-host-death family protein
MGTVTIRDLQRDTSRVVDEVERSRRPQLVTKHGRPVAAVVPIDAEELEDFILSNAPSFVASFREADQDLVAGRTVSATDFFKELDAQD